MNRIISKAWKLQYRVENRINKMKPLRCMEYFFLVSFILFFTGIMLFVYYYLFDVHNYTVRQIVNFHETWNPVFYFVLGSVFLFGFLCLKIERELICFNIRVWFERNC